MNYSALGKYFSLLIIFACILFLLQFVTNQTNTPPKAYAASPIQHVFIILEENHNWSQIKGSTSAPYINKTLLPMGGHAEQYYNPPGIHPSLPNYLWLEAGTNFGHLDDNNPSSDHQSTTNHLVTLLTKAGKTWKAYEEDIPGTNCPLSNTSNYAVRHEPFTYFDDVTNNLNSTSQNCIKHLRPFTQLTTDLSNNTIANYNFITPDLCHDGHSNSCNAFGTSDLVKQTDTWLSQEVPMILNSQAYKNNGVLLITWDEGEGGDGPIGMIVLSPLAKKNYTNSIHYTHSSTLKTMEEIFGVSPMLGGAATATDLSDFFTTSLTSGGPTNKPPTPTNISPTFACLGSCPLTPSPTAKVTKTPTAVPKPSATPSVAPCSNGTQTASVHAFKTHKHINGGISNLILLILQFIIQLLQQLLGGGISVPPTPTPTPSAAPSISPGVSPSTVPTTNPCP